MYYIMKEDSLIIKHMSLNVKFILKCYSMQCELGAKCAIKWKPV